MMRNGPHQTQGTNIISREIRELKDGELQVASGGRCVLDFFLASTFQTVGLLLIQQGNLAAGFDDLAEAGAQAAAGRDCR